MGCLLRDYNFILSIVSCFLLSVISSMIGLITILKRESLLGDAVSHSSLPGVIIAFLLIQQKGSYLLLGGFIAGIISILFIKFIKDRTRLDFDSILALILSSFFGLGMVLLTYVQKLPIGAQAGLKRYIFGQIASILTSDVLVIIAATVVVLILFALTWKEIKLFVFDNVFTKTSGYNPKIINLIIFIIISITIILQIQTVGVILSTAMLVAPGVAALQWSKKYNTVMLIAITFSTVSAILGTIISFLVPNVPTGPMITIIISAVALFSIFFGNYGVVVDNKKRKLSSN